MEIENKPKRFKHIMIDIETMGTKSYSAILSIGAVEFDLETGCFGNTFYVNIDLDSCLTAGLKTDDDTIEWWHNQSLEAKEALEKYKETLLNGLKMFKKFFKYDDYEVWGNSARFDLGILANAFEVTGIELPWNFKNERCVRTLVSFLPEVKQNMPFNGTRHNALDDCIHQIRYCSEIWNFLNKL